MNTWDEKMLRIKILYYSNCGRKNGRNWHNLYEGFHHMRRLLLFIQVSTLDNLSNNDEFLNDEAFDKL